jgi:multidrug resistance efflux pump
VPGAVLRVYAEEGRWVAAGAPLIELGNIPLQSALAHSESDSIVASVHARDAALHYDNYGPAVKDRERLTRQTEELSIETTNLRLDSPISGIVLTPRVGDLVGSFATSGKELLEVADLSVMRARIYISEHDMYKIRVGSRARLQVEGMVQKRDAQVTAIAPKSSQISPELADPNKYKGLLPPNFYTAETLLANIDSTLRPGMTGIGRVYGRRRSLAGLGWQQVKNFVGRKAW